MTLQAKSELKLERYLVEKIVFKINNKFDFSKSPSIIINPQFQRKIEPVDENRALVNLSVLIEAEEGKLPFFIDIAVSGLFNLKNWQENDALIKNNAVAILFPYLRSLVTMVTANWNYPPYIMPIVNVVNLFENNQ